MADNHHFRISFGKVLNGLLAICLIFGLATSVMAQTLPTSTSAASDTSSANVDLPETLTPETVRELVSRLSDQEVRQLLLQRLDAVAQENAKTAANQGQGTLQFVQDAGLSVVNSVVVAVQRVPVLWQMQSSSFSNFTAKLGTQGIMVLFAILALSIIVALAAELLVNRLAARWLDPIVARGDADTLGGTLRFLSVRLIRDLLGLLVFLLVTRLVGQALLTPDQAPFARLIMIYLVVLPRLVAAFARFILAPKKPEYRLVHTDQKTAEFLQFHLIGIAVLIGFSGGIVIFNSLNDVAMGQSRLGFWLALATHAYVVFIAWRAWDGLIMMMRGDEATSPTDEVIARYYPWFAIAVAICTWLLVEVLAGFKMFALLSGGPHYLMMALLLAAPLLDTMVRGLVKHMVKPMAGGGALAERAFNSTKRSYIRIGRVIVFALVIVLIARIWGIDLTNLAAAGVGAQLAAKLVEFLMVLAVGYLVWEVITLLINRKLADEQSAAGMDEHAEEPGGGEGGGAGGSRLSTVLPILRLTAQVAIAIITILVALSSLGIDTTPLLAGAGILGLAIGFGAQTLVRDVVSGIFFLIDDAFRVGEYLVIGETVGTVEKISIRSLQLRHHTGPVHTVPYGEIPKVTNNSRDWVIMKMKFTFPFETDVNKIKKIFKQIGKDILEADYADDIIQTFKSQGVYDVDDVGIVIRGKFMAKPGTQWIMRKDIYSRIQKALDEAGIQFARREVRVQIPGIETSELNGEQKQSVAAAASQAVDQKPA